VWNSAQVAVENSDGCFSSYGEDGSWRVCNVITLSSISAVVSVACSVNKLLLFRPWEGWRKVPLWVCLFVCLFFYLLTYLRKHTAVARSSSDGVVIRYVLPVLWMTSSFYTVGSTVRHCKRWEHNSQTCNEDKNELVCYVASWMGCCCGIQLYQI